MCIDSFLYQFTILPLRVLVNLLMVCLRFPFSLKNKQKLNPFSSPSLQFDLLCFLFIFISFLSLHFLFNLSWLYHLIRGQTLMKLYVLVGMIDTTDMLFSTIGRDMFDALHSSLHSSSNSTSHTIHILKILLLTGLYVICHSALHFFHLTALSVALGIHNFMRDY